MTTIYRCEGFHPIHETDEALLNSTPADIFAARHARREFGKRGYCRTLRLDSRSEDGSRHTYEASIGYTRRWFRTAIDGPNVRFTVYRTET